MDLTRRDMMKLGALGVVGTAGASQLPWSSVIEARAASLLAVSDTPLPFRTGFVRPPVLRPNRSRRDQDGVWTDYFTVTRDGAEGADPADAVDCRLRLQRDRTRADDQGTSWPTGRPDG